jgi:hypothetical protein
LIHFFVSTMNVFPARACPNPTRQVRGGGLGRRLNLVYAILLIFSLNLLSRADSNATVTGLVTDSAGHAIAEVSVVFTNVNSGVERATETNREGIYRLPGLLPGIYRANLAKDGFSSIVKGGIEVHVQDELSINFSLRAGSVFESITVEEGAPLVNTESAAVSTVVDRQFADNLPLNGRGFQSLIDLTPGVVLIVSTLTDGGQFSINGQRGNANYWTVESAPRIIRGTGWVAACLCLRHKAAPTAWCRWTPCASSGLKRRRRPRISDACRERRFPLSRAPAQIAFTVRCSTIFATTCSTPAIGSPTALVCPSPKSVRTISEEL